MPGRFFSLRVRPAIYFTLDAILVVLMVALDWAMIPRLRFSLGYFTGMALLAAPALLFLILGELGCRKRR